MDEKQLHETQPASPITPAPEQRPSFPTKMHPLPSHLSTWLFLLLAGFLILLITVYTLQYFFQKNGQQSITATMQPQLPSPTPTPDWKMHKDEKGLFTFSYPPDWQIEQQPNGSLILTAPYPRPTTASPETLDSSGESVKITNRPISETKKIDLTTLVLTGHGITPTRQLSNITQSTFNFYPSIEADFYDIEKPEKSGVFAEVTTGNSIYSFVAYTTTGNNFKAVLKKILTTAIFYNKKQIQLESASLQFPKEVVDLKSEDLLALSCSPEISIEEENIYTFYDPRTNQERQVTDQSYLLPITTLLRQHNGDDHLVIFRACKTADGHIIVKYNRNQRGGSSTPEITLFSKDLQVLKKVTLPPFEKDSTYCRDILAVKTDLTTYLGCGDDPEPTKLSAYKINFTDGTYSLLAP